MECAYFVAIVLICLNVLLIFVVGNFILISKLFINGICVMALALATKTVSGATLHPLVVMLLMSGGYFVILLSSVFASNMSLQYANFRNCIVS